MLTNNGDSVRSTLGWLSPTDHGHTGVDARLSLVPPLKYKAHVTDDDAFRQVVEQRFLL